jgi:hypothetical protein
VRGLALAVAAVILTLAPEQEPGWLWAAAHGASSVLLAWLLVTLADALFLRARYALDRGSCAYGQVTITAVTVPEPGPAERHLAAAGRVQAAQADLAALADSLRAEAARMSRQGAR